MELERSPGDPRQAGHHPLAARRWGGAREEDPGPGLSEAQATTAPSISALAQLAWAYQCLLTDQQPRMEIPRGDALSLTPRELAAQLLRRMGGSQLERIRSQLLRPLVCPASWDHRPATCPALERAHKVAPALQSAPFVRRGRQLNR